MLATNLLLGTEPIPWLLLSGGNYISVIILLSLSSTALYVDCKSSDA